MDLRKDCELIEVEYQNEGKKAVLTFLDMEQGEVLEVNFNKQSYDLDKKEFVNDKEKAEQVEEWCQEYFNTTFDNLTNAVGATHDVYHYEKFNSLWESTYPVKFEKEQKGMLFECEIESVKDNGNMILINYTEKESGILRQSKMNYSKYIEARKEWLVEPVQKSKQYEKFEAKFGVPVGKADEIIGKSVMVEVKVAFGKFPYGDIKKPTWSK